jgi:hypothetical protein
MFSVFLLVLRLLIALLVHSSALKKEGAHSSEKTVNFYQAALRYILDDNILRNLHGENPKPQSRIQLKLAFIGLSIRSKCRSR